MEKRVFEAALAGLLHDIGKFARRAGVGRSRLWDAQATEEYRYEHALLSGDFVEGYVPPAFKPLSPPAHHHRPQSALDRIVQLADHLSADEREPDRERHPRRLLSIFCRLAIELNGKVITVPSEDYRYHALAPLGLEREHLFPLHVDEGQGVEQAYRQLWEGNRRWPGFAWEAQQLFEACKDGEPDPEPYLENMLYLMQRYTWCIPSAYYGSLPDVSLYDHSRTTAALAACLTAHSDEQVQTWLKNRQGGPPVAMLVGGDISGIQEFIYTITSRGAASALRGRSLYLQLLTEAVARFLLRQLELPITNLIFASGGHFYLLARHNDEDRLRELQAQTSRILLAFHRGDLYLALEHVALHAEHFHGSALSNQWRKLSQERLRQAKMRKFSELGQQELHRLVFEPWRDEGNEEKACQVCGREHRDTNGMEGTRKCPQCTAFEVLGKDLRQARYLSLAQVEPGEVDSQAPPGDWKSALGCLGLKVDLGKEAPAPPAGAIRRVVFALDDEAWPSLSPRPGQAIGRRFLVNVTPIVTQEDLNVEAVKDRLARLPAEETPPKSEDVKPFEMMACQSKGIERLGILRMDVDDMGRIIGEGLGENATFSRLATLSFMVNFFFEGWAAGLARRHNRPDSSTDRVYSIYSGGDDLFYVGSWDAMPELAERIRSDLFDFSAEHPGVHASSGIELSGSKYPLYQAADDAHQALEQSKGRPGKNAITFLGQTMPWEVFVTSVRPMADKLRELVEQEEEGIPAAVLQRLQRFQSDFQDAQAGLKDRGQGVNLLGQEQVFYGPWLWRAAYYLKRQERRAKGTGKEEIKQIRKQLHKGHFRAIEWIGLAARWADLRRRGSS